MTTKTLPEWVPFNRAITIWFPFTKEPWVMVPASYQGGHLAVTLAHEAVHVEQWLELGRLGFLRVYATKAGRQRLEAAAFVASIRHKVTVDGVGYGEALGYYAAALATQYGLTTPVEQVALSLDVMYRAEYS